jgi:biotin-dependent carboxylase-like uncharacterized protein
VPTSGAFDRAAASLAQRLVGNPQDEAGLEIVLGGVRLMATATVTAVITGATASVSVGGVDVAVGEVFSWRAGTELRVGVASEGLRCYLAVRGGFALPRVLGSVSSDVLSGLGPAPISAGDTVSLAHRPAAEPLVSHTPSRLRPTGVLRVVLGPRDDSFKPQMLTMLLSEDYVVSPDSNRIGIRLQGPPLQRLDRRELPPEPLMRGAVQVPPNGQPIIMGPDHPSTGGYPVIACVVSADWDLCAHLRPGTRIRFALT